VPEFVDPVFAIENECFELVFAKTGSINSGTGCQAEIKPKTILLLAGRRATYEATCVCQKLFS
jgi:hypothetical protein